MTLRRETSCFNTSAVSQVDHVELFQRRYSVLSLTDRRVVHRDRSDLADSNMKSLADEAHAAARVSESAIRNLLFLFAPMVLSGTFCSRTRVDRKLHIPVRKVPADSMNLFPVGEAQYRGAPVKRLILRNKLFI